MRFILAIVVMFFFAAPAQAEGDSMFNSMMVSAYGMKAQSERARVISENIANANTAALSPGGKPYARKIITFKNSKDRQYNTDLVKVEKVGNDTKSPFPLKYMPDHPGANEAGYVEMPNVKTMVEMADMREAQRSYEANLGMIEQSRTMAQRTIDMLR